MSLALRTKLMLGAAAAVAVYAFVGQSDEQTVEVARNTAKPRTTRVQAKTQRQDPAQALYLLAHRVADDGAAHSLFSAHSWYTPPPPPPPAAPAPRLTAAQEAALRVPVAPPLPFAYMGSYTPDGSNPVFFLTQGDRVYSVRVGDTLNDTYSVDSVANGQLVMTYKPLKIQQQLTVGGAQ
ncbi:MAG: hypothetical protein ACJ8R9_29770 [Steroidobacteraceae bacterium]